MGTCSNYFFVIRSGAVEGADPAQHDQRSAVDRPRVPLVGGTVDTLLQGTQPVDVTAGVRLC